MPKLNCVSSIYIPCIPQRVVMCALAFSGITVGFIMHFYIKNTIKEIISSPYEHEDIPAVSREYQCFDVPIQTVAQVSIHAKVSWSNSLKTSVITGAWIPYMVSCVASGIVVDMEGPMHVWGLGVLLSAITAAMLPAMIEVSPYAVFACLTLYGLGFGVFFPCSSVVVAYWAQENERTIFTAFIESGLLLAIMTQFILIENGERWQTWLYVSCILSIVWVSVWYTLFYNQPTQHPKISPEQLQYHIKRTPGFRSPNRLRDKYKPIVPWKKVLLSPPFASLLLLSVASSWVDSLIYYQVNNYLLHVLNVTSVFVHGLDAAGMTIGACYVSILLHGWISDRLISSGLTSRTTNRRFFLLFTSYVSVVLLLVIPLLECNTTAVGIVFSLLYYMRGVAYAVNYANVVDLSPRYAGLLRGIIMASQSLSGILCRLLVDFYVTNLSDISAWATIFQFSAVIVVIFSSPYLCFGSGEIQPWNYFDPQEEQEGEQTEEDLSLRPTRTIPLTITSTETEI